MTPIFNSKNIKKLFKPKDSSEGEDNGQLTIIGGSSLFFGAPILSLKTASRVSDMVFFSSPEKSIEKVSDYIKSELSGFIWVPFEEVSDYIEKSDAVLMGPGFMRRTHEDIKKLDASNDEAYLLTRSITEKLLKSFPNKKWVIDAGSLQTMDPDWIPEGAIITPNRKEFKLLFGIPGMLPEDIEDKASLVQKYAKQYKCIIVLKGPTTIVASGHEVTLVKGGNPGLTKGGTGDVQAGLTVALLTKNEPFLAASAASHVIKASADEIHSRVGTFFNADDLAEEVPRTLSSLM